MGFELDEALATGRRFKSDMLDEEPITEICTST